MAKGAIEVRAEVSTSARTGVEMEALTGVTAALLTIYDMAKGLDRGMQIVEVRLEDRDRQRSRFGRGRQHCGCGGPDRVLGLLHVVVPEVAHRVRVGERLADLVEPDASCVRVALVHPAHDLESR